MSLERAPEVNYTATCDSCGNGQIGTVEQLARDGWKQIKGVGHNGETVHLCIDCSGGEELDVE